MSNKPVYSCSAKTDTMEWICLLGERKMPINHLIIKMQSFQTVNRSYMPIHYSKSITNFKNLQNANFEGKVLIFKLQILNQRDVYISKI